MTYTACSRLPISVRVKRSITWRTQLCRWVRTSPLDEHTDGWRKRPENWKADADGILIFVSRYTASHTHIRMLISSSKTCLWYSPSLSQHWLRYPHRASAQSPRTRLHFTLQTSINSSPMPYMNVTRPRYSPHKRARSRAFYYGGVDKLHLPWAVNELSALSHLQVSLFLFLAGLVVFLFNIRHTIFKVAISWVGTCTGLYVCITFLSIFRHDSPLPYYSPLPSSTWFLYSGTLFAVFQI